jgi:hypothetical protein
MPTFDFSASSAQNQLVSQAQQASTKLMSKAEATLSQRLGGPTSDLVKRIQKGGLKALDKSQVKNLAEAKLADTIFKSGPKDELLAVDVFGISDTNVLNSITGKMTGFASDMLESFRKNGGGITDLTSLIRDAANGSLSLNADALKDRVLSSMGGTSNILRTVSDGLQNTLTQGFGIPPEVYSQITATVAGVTTNFNAGNVKDASGIFSLVNQITGQKDLAQFFDVGAEANMLSGLFREAISLGIPGAIDALVTNAKSDKAADYALRANIQVAVGMADLDTTNLMVDTLGLNRVIADVPSAATLLLANYRIPAGTPNEGLDAELTKLLSTLDKLQPGWATYDRNGTAVSDLSLYTFASQDARKLMDRDPTHRINALVASTYKPVSMVEEAKHMYPLAII